jgi:ABC-type transport system substrate-binding protein
MKEIGKKRLVLMVMLAFLGTSLTTVVMSQQQKPVLTLPEEMDPGWRNYFEKSDFDGDGVPYAYDKYLGRDDSTIDYAKKQGGTLKWMSADISTLDPIMVTDTQSHEILGKVFEGLVQYVPATTKVMPCLAEAWQIGGGGKVYTFYLRDGVKFHDGSTFDADDVIYSFERFLDPSHASKRISFGTDYIDHIEKVNDYTVNIYLKFPFAPFLALLCYDSYKILPKEYTEANERYENGMWIKDWTEKPIGTGPYKFEYWNLSAGWKVNAYDDYWAGRSYLDSLQMIVQEEDETRVQAFKAGQVQWTGVPAAHWEEFNTQSPYKENLLHTVTLSTYWYELNCEKWPMNNTLIRQAVACAMDRESVLETVFKGRHIPSHGCLPPGLIGYSQELYDDYGFTYNPEKAKTLLDQAGAIDTDGDGIREYQGKPLEFEISNYVSDTWREGTKTFRANLGDVGIKVRYQEYDFDAILDMTESGNFVMLGPLGWIMDYPDPENFFLLWETEEETTPGVRYTNTYRYSNPEIDEMIQQLRVMIDPKARAELTQQIESIIRDDHPCIWFFHPRETTCIQPYVHNWIYGPNGNQVEKWLDVWLDPGHR